MGSEFYEQLGVDRAASAARIRSAYGSAVSRLTRRRRALVEQGGDPEPLDLQRVKLDEAWEVLSDPLRRRRYDALLGWTESPGARTADGVWSSVADGLVHPAAAVAAKLLRVTSRLTEIGVIPLAPSGAAEDPATLIPHDDDLTSPKAARLAPPTRLVDARSEPDGERQRAEFDGERLTPDGLASFERPSEPASTVSTLRIAGEPSFAMGGDPHDAPSRSPEHPLRVVDGGGSDVILLEAVRQERMGAPERLFDRPTEPPRPEPRPAPRRLPLEESSQLIDQHGYTGSLLRIVRERLGLTLQDVADHTRISVRYLEALESESREGLPSATFVRGYVREFARTLQLDPEPLVAGYMRRFDG
ncbi:MAG: helix-turn-helix domain-containing protein [Myxococcota bacterium]